MSSIELPVILYKYREDNEYTEQIFTRRSVWLSTAAGLNDPFECEVEPRAAAWMDEEQQPDTQDAHNFVGFLNQFSDMFQLTETTLGQKSPAELLKNVGIFSLSEDVTNPTMWAHYGANGQGLALGFVTLPGSKLASWNHLIRLNYEDGPIGVVNGQFWPGTRITIKGGSATAGPVLSLDDPTVRRVVATKTTEWGYEREWRYVELEGGEFEWPGPLFHVVFGWATPEEIKRKYEQMAKDALGDKCRFSVIRKDASGKRLIVDPPAFDRPVASEPA